MMKLTLIRETPGDRCTHGKLYVDNVYECYTLEDKDRFLEAGGEKIYGETAIPRGLYQVVIDQSQRFRRLLPRLLDVPYFEGIRIHSGNTDADTEGCILVGSVRGDERVLNSRATFDKLFAKLSKAFDDGDQIVIEVK